MSKGYFVDWNKEEPILYGGDRKHKPQLESIATWIFNDMSSDGILARDISNIDREINKYDPSTKSIVPKTQLEKDNISDRGSDEIFNGTETYIIKALIAELAISPPTITTVQEFEDRVRVTFKQLRRRT